MTSFFEVPIRRSLPVVPRIVQLVRGWGVAGGGAGHAEAGGPAVTAAATRIGEGLAGLRQEPPLVAARMQSQREHSESPVVADFAVGFEGAPTREEGASRAGVELPDPTGWVGIAPGRLWREALVVMRVSAQDHVCSRLVEHLPERARGRKVPAEAGVEARPVPVRQRAAVPVSGEVGPKPALLWRSSGASVRGRPRSTRSQFVFSAIRCQLPTSKL